MKKVGRSIILSGIVLVSLGLFSPSVNAELISLTGNTFNLAATPTSINWSEKIPGSGQKSKIWVTRYKNGIAYSGWLYYAYGTTYAGTLYGNVAQA